MAFSSDDITIGAGDTIVIDVYNERDLFVRTKVDKTGIVRVPLVGDILVVDKTTKVLSRELEAAFEDGYLVRPSVSVTIEAFRPFYIGGAVNDPGSYEFELDLTVDKAIAIAGGLKDRASSKNWFIIRGNNKDKLPVTAKSKVKPGDIVTIGESIF
jgi:polysaccharide export outer membrane protein